MSTAPTAGRPASASRARLWTGRILGGLLVLFFLFDATMKIMRHSSATDWAAQMGLSADAIFGIGLLLLACTVLYVVPRTAVLGAVLLTGYLGGATYAHVVGYDGVFPIAFALSFGVLVWVALGLRDRRVYALFAPPPRD